MQNEQKWNLKDRRGRVFGPFTTNKLMSLIEKGALDGEELISPLNANKWIEISKYPEFYDAILDSLSSQKKELTQAQKEKELIVVPVSEAKKRGRAVVEEVSSLDLEKKPSSPHKEDSKVEPIQPESTQKSTIEIIDLKPKEEVQKKSNRRFVLFVGAAVSLIAVIAFFIDDSHKRTSLEKNIHLKFPTHKKNELSIKDQQMALKKALSLFQKDTFEGYFSAQNILVALLEANNKYTEAISLLCLTYRELWPNAYKDSQDLQALTALVQLSQKENSMDVHGATCKSVQGLLVGSEETMKNNIAKAIDDFPTAAVLYEMRSEVLNKSGQKNPAIAYLQKTQSLWPDWIKPFFMEAQIRTDIKDYSNAVRILKSILNIQPEHSKSKVEMGIIEISHFSNSRGLDYLQVGLQDEKIPSPLRVRGYFALANHYLNSNPKLALEYAQKAYSLDPKNMALRDTILSLGGESALSAVKSEDTQLMVVGDSYFRNKNYLAAQAEYKTAFEVNPKNSLAALKASESLWVLNQTEDAIDWAKKSIQADPKFIEGYIQLADYFAQKFDFKQASEYLSVAQHEGRNNYLVFRGWAQLELRRQNTKSAIKMAEQALKLYDSDVDSLVILAKSYGDLRQHDKAYQYSSKAIQIDPNNMKAHEVYAESLLGLRGILVASQYLGEKIATFPNQVEYKIAMGVVYLKDERFSEAAAYLESALDFDVSNYRAHMLLSRAYELQNNFSMAMKTMLKAASLDPTNAEPLFELGQIYLKDSKTLSKSLKSFQKVLTINPRYPRASYMAGRVSLLMGNKKAALEYASAEKKLNPSLADPYILQADIFFSEGKFQNAIAELRRAVQIRPEDSNLYIAMARSHRLLGQLDIANAMLRTAISKESGNADIYKEQGMVFEKLGLADEARSSFSRYLEIKPNAEDRNEIQNKINTLGGY